MDASTLDVELLLGPYRSGKTRTLVSELLAFKTANPLKPVLVLVPSARYGKLFREFLHAEVLRQRAAGLFGVEILPFYTACLEELRRRRGEPNVIPEEIRPVIMSRVLNEMKADGEISALAAICDFHGTASAELELIDEFQRAGLSPADLFEKLEQSCCQESRFLELASIYARYVQKLKQLNCLDQKSMAMLSREALFAEAPCEQEKPYGLLVIDGFDRVSHLQGQIFAGIARSAERTLIAFDYSDSSLLECTPGASLASPEDASAPDLSFDESFACAPAVLRQSSEDYRWKQLSYEEILRNLNPRLRIMAPSKQTNCSVQVSSSLDRFCEMQELVRQVKIALVERKRSLNEILVVIRSYDAYAGAIETAFQDGGINYFIDGSRAVAELASWRFIKQLFTIAENDFRRKDFVDLLRSPYLNLDALALPPRVVSQLDRISYDERLVGGMAGWKKLVKNVKFADSFAALLKILEELSFGGERKKAYEHASKLEDMLEKYMRFPASDADLRSLRANAERETIKAVRRSLNVLISQEQLLGSEHETFAEFFKRLEMLIEKTNFARPKPEAAALTISSAELASNRKFKEIFIVGLVEGDFPRHSSAKGFLSPEETKRWLSFGIDIRNPRHEPGFERALFYSILERADEQLHLSLPQFEMSSEELLPSFYLSELQEKIEFTVERLNPYRIGQSKPYSSRDAISSVLWNADALGHDQFQYLNQISAAHAGVSVQWIPLQNALQAVLGRMQSQIANPYNGYLEEFFNCRALTLNIPETWSASRLNDYGKCPFRFWSSFVLDMVPREEPVEGLNPALIGLTYHKILEIFFQNFKRTESELRSEKTPEIFEHAFSEGIKWLQQRADFTAGPYFEHEQKELRFRVWRFLRNELERIANDPDGYMPEMFEVGFGRRDSLFPPLVLQDEFGKKILLSGSIDRVDLQPPCAKDSESSVTGMSDVYRLARVIDYKSSSRSISIKEAEQGRNLQLPIYALALQKAILPQSRVSTGSYLSISSARSVGKIEFESPEHGHIIDRAEYLVKSYISDIERGVFSVKPNGRDVCKTCQHKSACRITELKAVMEESFDAETY